LKYLSSPIKGDRWPPVLIARVGAFVFLRASRGDRYLISAAEKEKTKTLDFCADRGITRGIELIEIEPIDEAYQRILKSDVKYRFVIDLAR
jgi:uncharacterized zinc-type alcohol dehydrogenase-like protein